MDTQFPDFARIELAQPRAKPRKVHEAIRSSNEEIQHGVSRGKVVASQKVVEPANIRLRPRGPYNIHAADFLRAACFCSIAHCWMSACGIVCP